MKEMKFDVSLDEANLILEGLGKLPFEKVFNLVNKLQDQARNQLQTEENGHSEVAQAKAATIQN